MAVHPFARKCEEIIGHLREVLEDLRRAKKTGEQKSDDAERETRRLGKLADGPTIMLLGSHEMEQQGFATGSHAGIKGAYQPTKNSGPKKKKAKSGDPQMDALRDAYDTEMDKCRRQNVSDNDPYFRCLTNSVKLGGNGSECASMRVPMSCPGGNAARKALDEYIRERGGLGQYKKDGKSGGGSGGGF